MIFFKKLTAGGQSSKKTHEPMNQEKNALLYKTYGKTVHDIIVEKLRKKRRISTTIKEQPDFKRVL